MRELECGVLISQRIGHLSKPHVADLRPGRRQGPEDDDLDDGHRGEPDDPGSSDEDHYQKENGKTRLQAARVVHCGPRRHRWPSAMSAG